MRFRLILDNHMIVSEGDYRMFVRMAGTEVSDADFYKDGFVAQESAIIIQKYGLPDHDSGQVAKVFPPTIAGLKEANWVWKNLNLG